MGYLKSFLKLWKDAFTPFPRGVKKWVSFRWWLVALFRSDNYCSQCGWPLIYVDNIYDVEFYEINPEVVAMCTKCGIEYKWYEGEWIDRKHRHLIPADRKLWLSKEWVE